MGVGRGAVVTLAMQWSKYLTGLVALVLLARLLQPTDYGLVAMSAAVAGLASVIGDLGLSLAALQAKVLSQHQKSNLFWVNGLVGTASGVLVAVAAVPLAAFYGEPRLVGVTLALAVVFPINGFTVQFKVEVNRSLRFLALGMIDLVAQVGGLVVAIVLAATGGGYWALVTQQIVAALIALTMAIGAARWRPSLPTRSVEMGGLLRFGRDTFALHLANYVTTNIDTVLVGRFWGPALLGLYNRAFQVVLLPLDQVLAPLTRVFLPRLSAVEHDAGAFDALLARLQRVLAYVIVGPLSLIAATSSALFTVVLGPQWGQAAPYMQILVVGAVFQTLGYVYYWAFLARGRTKLLFVSELWGRIPMIVLMLSLVHLGAEWVAVSVAVGQFLIWFAGTVYFAGRIGVDTKSLLPLTLRPVGLYAVATLLCFAVGTRLGDTDPLLRLVVLVGVWAATCTVGMVLAPYRRDLRSVLDAVRPRKTPAGVRGA